MSPTLSNAALVIIAALVAAVGVLDSTIGRHWDLLAVFGLELLLLAVLTWRLQRRRPEVPLRADLVAWLRERSALTGEPPEVIADRCIAASRADLVGP